MNNKTHNIGGNDQDVSQDYEPPIMPSDQEFLLRWVSRFYELYMDGRKNDKAPINYIDYFKAKLFLSKEIEAIRQTIKEERAEAVKEVVEYLEKNFKDKRLDRIVVSIEEIKKILK